MRLCPLECWYCVTYCMAPRPPCGIGALCWGKRKDRTILKIKKSNVIAKIKGCIQTVFQNIPTTLAPICYCLDEPMLHWTTYIVSPKVTPLVEQEFDKWRCFESISKATVSHYSRNHPMNFLHKHYYKKKKSWILQTFQFLKTIMLTKVAFFWIKNREKKF